MAEEKSQRGGARAGAGRKPKAVEEDLQRRLKRACKSKELDEIFALLVADCKSPSFRVRHAARGMLFDRLYGKVAPPTHDEGEGDAGDGTFIVRVPIRMSAEEWQKHVKPPEPSQEPAPK